MMQQIQDMGGSRDTTGSNGNGQGGTGGQQRDEVRMKLLDQNGNPKTLILKYE
jgi:hypothetical protein